MRTAITPNDVNNTEGRAKRRESMKIRDDAARYRLGANRQGEVECRVRKRRRTSSRNATSSLLKLRSIGSSFERMKVFPYVVSANTGTDNPDVDGSQKHQP